MKVTDNDHMAYGSGHAYIKIDNYDADGFWCTMIDADIKSDKTLISVQDDIGDQFMFSLVDE